MISLIHYWHWRHGCLLDAHSKKQITHSNSAALPQPLLNAPYTHSLSVHERHKQLRKCQKEESNKPHLINARSWLVCILLWKRKLHLIQLENEWNMIDIDSFHVTSFQGNLASYHTRDRHVGFLFAQPNIRKHNKMFCNFLSSSNHNTKLHLSDKNISTHTQLTFKSWCEVNQKLQFVLLYFLSIPRRKRSQEVWQIRVCISA